MVGTLTVLDHYYDKQETSIKECLLGLKSIILSIDEDIIHIKKYQIPFFRYRDYNLGFLWVYRKKVLIGFIMDKKLLSTSLTERKKDNVFTMEINPLEDIPISIVQQNFNEIIDKYNR